MKFSDSRIYCTPQKKYISQLFFLLLIIFGIITGTVIISTTENPGFFYRLLFTHNIYKTKADVSFLNNFIRNFLPVVFLLVIQFFSGYFAFGQVFAYFTAVYRGIVSGISAAFVYIVLGAKGFFMVILTIVPFAVTTSVILILGAREAVRQSRQVAEYSFFGRAELSPPDTKLYLIKFTVLVIFAVVLSAVDCIFTYFFRGIFFNV